MTTLTARADALAGWGAPPIVQLMTQWLDLPSGGGNADLAASIWLAVADVAARADERPFVLMPEVERLLQLDRQLPAPLGLLWRPQVQRQVAGVRTVARTYQATTPLLKARASFRDAAGLADDRSQWGIGAPQMAIEKPLPPLLPADGWLWRGRLRKRTDLLMPTDVPLVTRETIEITAEGRDRGSNGFRRYRHTLIGSETGPGLLELRDDSGWIELRGTATAVLLRISKRVTVLLPEDMEQRYGGVLQVALSTLLWLWAEGFLRAVALPDNGAAARAPMPAHTKAPTAEPKQIALQPDGAGGKKARVAVLGGGPAGLACAWLLSNPVDAQGRRAWEPPRGLGLSLQITLVEKAPRVGGKAASTRRNTPEDRRVEEHGLHVLMGCYSNLLRVLGQLGATGGLQPRRATRIPMGQPGDPEVGVTLDLDPWPRRDDREPLAQWFLQERAAPIDLRFLGLPFDLAELWRTQGEGVTETGPPLRVGLLRMGLALQQPRPLLRLVVGLWSHVARVAPVGTTDRLNPTLLQRLGLQLLLKRMAKAELLAVSQVAPLRDAPQAPGLVVPLARQLRVLARAALPADSAHADVRLAGELVELATTVTIGLAQSRLFPNWAIGRPDDPLDGRFTAWARAVQSLDGQPLDAWLYAHGAAPGFAEQSRVLAAVTAGLFTTPAGIAAGTFVHGLLRLLLTYGDSPYMMLRGGTDEAVIAPIARALEDAGVALLVKHDFQGITLTGDGSATAAQLCGPGGQLTALDVDAVVLAIPPFKEAFEGLGLPTALTDAVRPIESRATLGIQHWTDGPARFPGLVVSGLGGPMRCVAAMDHLQDDEGFGVPHAPVYYCGDVDDDVAESWRADLDSRAAEWLADHAAKFQDGATVPAPYPRVNLVGSERYVAANCATQAARPDIFRTGVPNLWLAGDWTRSSFACGSIEAAVTSGLEAARHLLWTLRCTVHFPIVGPFYDEDTL